MTNATINRALSPEELFGVEALMTAGERHELIKALGQVIHDEVKRALQPVQKQLDRLELRFEHAELRVREMRFAGIWTSGSRYQKGNTVQHHGSTWHCNLDDCSTAPGADPIGWTLQAKRGADAGGRP